MVSPGPGFLVGLALVSAIHAFAAEAITARAAHKEMQIAVAVVHDQAVSDRTIHGAQSRVANLFRDAAIRFNWQSIGVGKLDRLSAGSSSESVCEPDRALRLEVDIVGNAKQLPFPVSAHALGATHISNKAEQRHCRIYVLLDRAGELASRNSNYRLDLVLSFVIAHEIGHVLLGPEHSRHGLMRAGASPGELAAFVPDFSRDDIDRLRLLVSEISLEGEKGN